MSCIKKFTGELIKQQRINKNLTQEELAYKLNTDRQYVSKLENGKINMSLDYLGTVLSKLNCSFEEFYK